MQGGEQSDGTFEGGASRRQGKAVNRRHRGGRGGGRSVGAARAPRSTLAARLRYWFDSALSRGPSVVIGWLGLLTLAIIVFTAVVIVVFRITGINGGDRLGFGEAIWQALLRVVDAGTFAADSGWLTRLVGLAVTLCGIFLAGSLIGLIANAVDQRIELLRKGRSLVLEHDHTLILGWSDRVPAIVKELIIANDSRKRAAVVVLAETDKTTMEDTLRDQIEDFGTTRLVCRSGTPSSLADLAMAAMAGARSVIVVGGNDAAVVKALLAVRAASGWGAAGPSAAGSGASASPPVVAEVNDAVTAQSIRALFGERVVIVNSDTVVAELTAQACRQRGLSQVFRELLDFDGDEIYLATFAELVGRTYGEAQLAFESCSLMGVLRSNGELQLNPPASAVLADGDQLIGIAADDSEFRCTGLRPIPPTAPVAPQRDLATDRRMVLVGWSSLGPRVVRELDEFLGAETLLEIVVDPAIVDIDEVRATVAVRNIAVDVIAQSGGPQDLALHAARRAFHEVIVLGRRDGGSKEEADAHTLLTLLAFSQVVQRLQLGSVRIVAELLEQRHAPLAEATGADDFIVSDELTSLMMAQLSERHELDRVFRDLFDREGSSIELVPAARYGAAAASSFAEVVATASAQGHSALGYRRAADETVVLNPPKSSAIRLTPDDHVVVLRS